MSCHSAHRRSTVLSRGLDFVVMGFGPAVVGLSAGAYRREELHRRETENELNRIQFSSSVLPCSLWIFFSHGVAVLHKQHVSASRPGDHRRQRGSLHAANHVSINFNLFTVDILVIFTCNP